MAVETVDEAPPTGQSDVFAQAPMVPKVLAPTYFLIFLPQFSRASVIERCGNKSALR
jgi:hypothetical protein